MQLFDAIENCFPAMEKQYQEICPPPEDFWTPVLMERALREAGAEDVICSVGSLYMTGAVRAACLKARS